MKIYLASRMNFGTAASIVVCWITSFCCTSAFAQTQEALKLRYTKDAGTVFTDALPIGNGRLGGMVYGIVSKDVIGLNECTVWSGNPGNNNKVGASNALAQARSQVFSGNYTAADATVAN